MDIEKVIRTVLRISPGIRAKELVARVRAKTDLSRSTIYEHLTTLCRKGKIYREKGRYWLEKPEKLETDDKIKALKLAAKLATETPPAIIRDVDLKIGKYRVKVEHE